ncbi:MAG: hypothetical protein ACUVXB_16745 [Bryobacteraceae bacterium]
MEIERGNLYVPSWSTGAGWAPGSFTPASPAWFNAKNQLVNPQLGITYDAAGNQTAIGGFTFAYDAESRLVSSTLNSVTTNYVYDGEGRRVKKGSVVMVYDAFGRLAAEYGGTADPVGTEYLTADHLGSTRLVTSSTGAERRCLDYLPFGEQMTQGMLPADEVFYPQGVGYTVPGTYTFMATHHRVYTLYREAGRLPGPALKVATLGSLTIYPTLRAAATTGSFPPVASAWMAATSCGMSR